MFQNMGEKVIKFNYNCTLIFHIYNRLCISCDKCDKWFHITCVGIKKLQVSSMTEWFCPHCSSSSSSNTSSDTSAVVSDTNSIPSSLSSPKKSSCSSPTSETNKSIDINEKENLNSNSNTSPATTFYFLSPITKAATAMTKLKQDSAIFKIPAKLKSKNSTNSGNSKNDTVTEADKYICAAELILRKEGKPLTSSELFQIALKESNYFPFNFELY